MSYAQDFFATTLDLYKDNPAWIVDHEKLTMQSVPFTSMKGIEGLHICEFDALAEDVLVWTVMLIEHPLTKISTEFINHLAYRCVEQENNLKLMRTPIKKRFLLTRYAPADCVKDIFPTLGDLKRYQILQCGWGFDFAGFAHKVNVEDLYENINLHLEEGQRFALPCALTVLREKIDPPTMLHADLCMLGVEGKSHISYNA